MSIEGLRDTAGSPKYSISDDVGAAVEALDMLGQINDRDQVARSITNEFSALQAGSGKTGEPYVELPRELISLGGIVAALDKGTFPESYPKTYVWDTLWTPGTSQNSYT